MDNNYVADYQSCVFQFQQTYGYTIGVGTAGIYLPSGRTGGIVMYQRTHRLAFQLEMATRAPFQTRLAPHSPDTHARRFYMLTSNYSIIPLSCIGFSSINESSLSKRQVLEVYFSQDRDSLLYAGISSNVFFFFVIYLLSLNRQVLVWLFLILHHD